MNAYGCGTIFKVTTSGAFTTLYTFQGGQTADFLTPIWFGTRLGVSMALRALVAATPVPIMEAVVWCSRLRLDAAAAWSG